MTTTVTSLADLKGTKTATAEATTTTTVVERVQKLDKQGRAYATGRRKSATARVWVKRGTGKITVNGKPIEVYFGRPTQRMIILQPLELANRNTELDVVCTVVGSGLSGQAGAIRHGVSRALTYFEPTLRGTMKEAGFLTRDAREVERKKPGLRKARRRKQWKKR